jgi:L-seryl-tRNA(Ser) seleniumtransferase
MTSQLGGGTSGLASLPSVEKVRSALPDSDPHDLVVSAARRAVEGARVEVRDGSPVPSFEDIVARAKGFLVADTRSTLASVINATGVLLHTNLGRAPLGEAQLAAVFDIARGYSNLEYDLDRGGRGSRHSHAVSLLTVLTGAGSALVVNNNAAAVLVSLAALCGGRDVIISRGELIEIGGQFRIPDVMALSGARLVEVGTTNRTHLSDYADAIGPETAAIMKVHPSNYRVTGFTSSVSERDLVQLARERNVLLIHDLGSGLVADPRLEWTRTEPIVSDSIAAGVDVVTFSGDKLFGGPQAGIILGREDVLDEVARHPLMRAVRIDKLSLAALQATVDAYLHGEANELPLWQMATVEADVLRDRAVQLAGSIRASCNDRVKVETIPTSSLSGGGAIPGVEVPSWGIQVRHAEKQPNVIEERLRASIPPVIARIDDDRVILDLRTVWPDDDARLERIVTRALSD